MLSNSSLQEIGFNEVCKVFAESYLKRNLHNAVISAGHCGEDLYQYFLGFKTEDERPKMKADDHGWAVYALVYIDESSGTIKKFKYQTDEQE